MHSCVPIVNGVSSNGEIWNQYFLCYSAFFECVYSICLVHLFPTWAGGTFQLGEADVAFMLDGMDGEDPHVNDLWAFMYS